MSSKFDKFDSLDVVLLSDLKVLRGKNAGIFGSQF